MLFVVPRCQFQMYYGTYILPMNQKKEIEGFLVSYMMKLRKIDYSMILDVEKEIIRQNFELYVNNSMFRKLATAEKKR